MYGRGMVRDGWRGCLTGWLVDGSVKSAWGSGRRKTFYSGGRAGLPRVRRPLRVHRRRFLYRSRSRQAADRSAGPVSHGRRHIATSFTRRQTATFPPPPLTNTQTPTTPSPTRHTRSPNGNGLKTEQARTPSLLFRRLHVVTVYGRIAVGTDAAAYREGSTAHVLQGRYHLVVSRGIREDRARAVRHWDTVPSYVCADRVGRYNVYLHFRSLPTSIQSHGITDRSRVHI